MAGKNKSVDSMMVYDGTTFDPSATLQRLNEVFTKFNEELKAVQGDTPAFGVESSVKKDFVDHTKSIAGIFLAERLGRSETAPIEKLQAIYDQVIASRTEKGLPVDKKATTEIARTVSLRYNKMYAMDADGESYTKGAIESNYVVARIKDGRLVPSKVEA